MTCPHCQSPLSSPSEVCPACGGAVAVTAPVTEPAGVALLGRDDELREIQDYVNLCVAEQRPGVVLVLGPPGSGKQRLLRESLRGVGAPPGLRVCRGRGPLLGPSPPAQQLAAALALALGLTSEEGHRSPLDEESAARLVRETPPELRRELETELDLWLPGEGMERSSDDAPTLATPPRGLLQAAVTAGPLALLLELPQDAELSLPSQLSALCEALPPGPLLLGLSGPSDLAPSLEGALPADSLVLELGPLGEAEIQALFDTLLDGVVGLPGDLARRAYERSEGRPGRLLAFVHSLVAEGVIRPDAEGWRFEPARYRPFGFPDERSLRQPQAVAGLLAEDRELLRHAAAMGPIFWLEGLAVLARAAHRGEGARSLWRDTPWLSALRTRVEGLVDRGVLIPCEDPRLPQQEAYGFVRRDEQSALLQEVPPGELARQRGLLAEWLASRRPDPPELARLELEAQLLEAAGRQEGACSVLLQAGRIAAERIDLLRAAELLEAARRRCPAEATLLRMEILHSLGALRAASGQEEQALVHFGEMLEWAWALDHRGKGGAAHDRIGRLHRQWGDLDGAMDHFMTAWGLFESVGDEAGVAACIDDIGQIHWLHGHHQEALNYLRRALEQRERLGDQRSVALGLHNLALVLADRGDFAEARAHMEAALEQREALGHIGDITRSLADLGQLFATVGALDRAKELWDEGLTLARSAGDGRQEAVFLLHLGQTAHEAGEDESARRQLEQAVRLAQVHSDTRLQAQGRAQLALALARSEGAAAAESLAEAALATASETGSPSLLATAQRIRAELATAAGDLPLALDLLRAAAKLLEDRVSVAEQLRVLEALHATLLLAVRPQEADATRARLEALRLRTLASRGETV